MWRVVSCMLHAQVDKGIDVWAIGCTFYAWCLGTLEALHLAHLALELAHLAHLALELATQH
jgi:hypothetical protein